MSLQYFTTNKITRRSTLCLKKRPTFVFL